MENEPEKKEPDETQALEQLPARKVFSYLLAFLGIALIFFAGVCFINHRKAAAALRFTALTKITQTDTQSEAPPPATANAAGKINLNTADAALIATLPGIGEVKAQKIVDYRAYYGIFTEPADLLKIDGIGEKTLAKITPYIIFSDAP